MVMALMAVGGLHPATASCCVPSLQGCSLPFPKLQHLLLRLPQLLQPRTAVGAFALRLICTQSLESRPGDQELLPGSGCRMTAAFDHLLQDFPTVQAAFGYGSGIFKQPSAAGGRHASQPMLDFIFAVRDPQGWHEQVITTRNWAFKTCEMMASGDA